jgi:transposase
MAAPRLVVELSIGKEDVTQLMAIARSRTEPASWVERARILLAYRDDPSFFAVGRLLGVHHQTVQRCVERAAGGGALAALDDSPRPGKKPAITVEAKEWLVALACRKAKDLGYPHELWTTRLLARHAREHGPLAGHACLADLVQGTVCKILDAHAGFGAFRRSTLSWWRSVRISASSEARDRKSPITAHQISLRMSPMSGSIA